MKTYSTKWILMLHPVSLLRKILIHLAALLWTAATLGADQATAPILSPGELLLGDSSGTPLVYFKPAAGLTLVLSKTTHDDFGQAVGYKLEFGGSPKLTVLVQRSSEPNGSPAKFTARAGAHSLAELTTAKSTAPMVALYPADAGGVVLAAPGELQLDFATEFAYDDFGRRQVAAQTFPHAGAKWKVTFSGYTRDGFGRITGYRAHLTQVAYEPP